MAEFLEEVEEPWTWACWDNGLLSHTLRCNFSFHPERPIKLNICDRFYPEVIVENSIGVADIVNSVFINV